MKTAVETIFVGKGRLYNRRFMQMCSHYLVDPVAAGRAESLALGNRYGHTSIRSVVRCNTAYPTAVVARPQNTPLVLIADL
jgi:hypothetical protein